MTGSEELFRPTRPTVVRETDEIITEVIDHPPPPRQMRELQVTPEELELLLDAIQASKYPDKVRPKPSLERFERLDLLRSKLQEAIHP